MRLIVGGLLGTIFKMSFASQIIRDVIQYDDSVTISRFGGPCSLYTSHNDLPHIWTSVSLTDQDTMVFSFSDKSTCLFRLLQRSEDLMDYRLESVEGTISDVDMYYEMNASIEQYPMRFLLVVPNVSKPISCKKWLKLQNIRRKSKMTDLEEWRKRRMDSHPENSPKETGGAQQRDTRYSVVMFTIAMDSISNNNDTGTSSGSSFASSDPSNSERAPVKSLQKETLTRDRTSATRPGQSKVRVTLEKKQSKESQEIHSEEDGYVKPQKKARTVASLNMKAGHSTTDLKAKPSSTKRAVKKTRSKRNSLSQRKHSHRSQQKLSKAQQSENSSTIRRTSDIPRAQQAKNSSKIPRTRNARSSRTK